MDIARAWAILFMIMKWKKEFWNAEGARNIPHEKLRQEADTLDKNQITVTYCNKGNTGNAAQNILINRGFKKVYNISGGHRTYEKRLLLKGPPMK